MEENGGDDEALPLVRKRTLVALVHMFRFVYILVLVLIYSFFSLHNHLAQLFYCCTAGKGSCCGIGETNCHKHQPSFQGHH
jgi:hypothetical protein